MKEFEGYDIFGPITLGNLMERVSSEKGSVAFLAGGTDLIIELKKGKMSPQLVVDLSQVQELNGVIVENGNLIIGGAVPFSQLVRDPLVCQKARCLAQAASKIGSVQIRNRGTLGGNIASASPAGDCLPVLLVLKAIIITLAPDGVRRIPINQVLIGRGRTCLRPKELITGIEIPLLEADYISGFEKIGSRTSVSIARLNMAAVINYDRKSKIIKEARIAVGALGETAFRLEKIEQKLLGQEINSSLLKGFEEMLMEAVDKAIPRRSSQPYKREAIRGLARDIFVNLFGANLIQGGRIHD